MKLYSLLFGNTSNGGEPETSALDKSTLTAAMACSKIEDVADQPVTHAPPHVSLNLDRLRKIFQALSSINDNKTVDEDVDEEPLQMRQKFLGIFERLQRRFATKHTTRPADKSDERKRKTLKISRAKLRALLSKKHFGSQEAKWVRNWARINFNRITSSMRRVKSDSFLSRKMDGKLSNPAHDIENCNLIENSRTIVNSASEIAHKNLVKHLEHSSQHCLDDIDFYNYEFPFENLIFEGGGAKVHTYIGAIKCLEEAGIKPKRLAGTSAGAITAGLLAVGYTSEEIHILYEYDVEYNVKDGTCGLLSLLPNMLRHYGWNPGERAMRWFGECLAVKTGNPDITFQEVLDQYGVELCIVAVNLTTNSEEYFHPKTTPDMPIKLAARMSSSLPGYFQPVRQGSNVYVDGGLLCNYPLHVFDGWWLSMQPEDAFYKRLGSMENLSQIMDRKNRFGVYNAKTLGFCMFSMFDDKALRYEVEKRHKLKVSRRPRTKLAVKRMKLMKERDKREETRDNRLNALSRFFKVLRQVHMSSPDGELRKEALVAELTKQLDIDQSLDEEDKKLMFSKHHAAVIFGAESDFKKIIHDIPASDAGIVTNSDLIAFLTKNNVDLQGVLLSHYVGRPEVTNFGAFFMRIQESLMNSARRVYIQPEDLDRTVGINTDYIKMDDFSLEREDQEFLIQQGYMATAAYLRYWIHHNKKSKKSDILSDLSQESSNFTTQEDSDYSPIHVYSDSVEELSEEEDIVESLDSNDQSPLNISLTECTNSASTRSSRSENYAKGLKENEEVVIAEIEYYPDSDLPETEGLLQQRNQEEQTP